MLEASWAKHDGKPEGLAERLNSSICLEERRGQPPPLANYNSPAQELAWKKLQVNLGASPRFLCVIHGFDFGSAGIRDAQGECAYVLLGLPLNSPQHVPSGTCMGKDFIGTLVPTPVGYCAHSNMKQEKQRAHLPSRPLAWKLTFRSLWRCLSLSLSLSVYSLSISGSLGSTLGGEEGYFLLEGMLDRNPCKLTQNPDTHHICILKTPFGKRSPL